MFVFPEIPLSPSRVIMLGDYQELKRCMGVLVFWITQYYIIETGIHDTKTSFILKRRK